MYKLRRDQLAPKSAHREKETARRMEETLPKGMMVNSHGVRSTMRQFTPQMTFVTNCESG